MTYLRAAGENTARRGLQFFLLAIQRYSLPSRIRTDEGGEYAHVRRFMERQMGDNRGSALVGRSVHNQRIERLWRDVYAKVLDVFYRLFYYMESQGILNMDNDIHRFALHFVYIPRIDRELMQWMEVHNNQGVRTMSYQSPLNVWYNGVIRNLGSSSSAIQNIRDFNLAAPNTTEESILHEFEIDWDLQDPDSILTLSNIPNPMTDAQFIALQAEINPLSDSDHQGVDIYGKVVLFIQTQSSNST